MGRHGSKPGKKKVHKDDSYFKLFCGCIVHRPTPKKLGDELYCVKHDHWSQVIGSGSRWGSYG